MGEKIFFGLCLMFIFSCNAVDTKNKVEQAQNAPKQKSKQAAYNLNGVWADSASNNFTNCTLVMAQHGDSIFVTHYLEFNGVPMVEYGKGIIFGDSVVYNVWVAQSIPGWSLQGIHKLSIQKDGTQLNGMYFDSKGNSGALIFNKKLPK